MLSFWATEIVLTGNRTRDSLFRSYSLCSYNILFETSSLGAVLLSCAVCKLQRRPSSPKLEPITDFSWFWRFSCNRLLETKNYGFGAVLLSCLVSELHKPPSGLEPKSFFGVVGFIAVISSPKQTTLVSASFFYHICFPNYRNHLYRDPNAGHIFIFVPVMSSLKQIHLILTLFYLI
jgi:hypothetical protein